MDRVVAAKHSIAGQGLAKIVCKATTEEVMGPKKKHLDYLLQCTNEPNVSIPQLADLLIERTQHANWVIVFKGLITIHNLMNYGNERFTQYLASNNCTFNLGGFLDKQGVQGYDMSKFIRKYSTYMNEKAVSYRAMAFDFCKVKRGKDDGLLRTMASEKLLKALPVLQKQLDALLEFDCTPNELTNGVVNACFMLLFKDLIRLFACYNDGIINLLEKYFDMNKKQCKEALDIYKKFLVRMDRVSEFLKVAENVGIDKGDIPDLAKAPASLLDALEQHLNALEGKKGVTTPTTKPAGFATAIDTISGNSSVQVSDEEMKRILEEEKSKLQELKDQRMKEMKTSPSSSPQNQAPATNNPFLTSQPATTQVDLFGAPESSSSTGKASDDLLNLTGNPFVENVRSVMTMNSSVNAMSSQNAFSTPAWGATNASSGSFTSDADFAKVFQNSNSSTTAALDVSTSVTAAQPLPASPLAPPQGSSIVSVKILSMFIMKQNCHYFSSSVTAAVPFGVEDSLDPLDPLSGMVSIGGTMAPSPLSSSPITIGGSSGVGAFCVPPLSPCTSPQIGRAFGVASFGTSPGTMGSGFGAQQLGTSPGTMGGSFGAQQLSTSPGNMGGGFGAAPLGTSPGTMGFDAFGDVLQPVSSQSKLPNAKPVKAIQGDLDSSLANLAGNLHMDGPASQVKKTQHEWQPKNDSKKTGGSNWAPQPITSMTNTSWAPQGFTPVPVAGPHVGYTGQAPAMGPNPGMMTGMGMAPQPGMAMAPQPGMGMTPQPGMGMGMGHAPGMYGAPTMPMGMGMMPKQPPAMAQPKQPSDPFGAL
ncbi:hypothetical protein ScPMuIL_013464 [Solemya velum]